MLTLRSSTVNVHRCGKPVQKSADFPLVCHYTNTTEQHGKEKPSNFPLRDPHCKYFRKKLIRFARVLPHTNGRSDGQSKFAHTPAIKSVVRDMVVAILLVDCTRFSVCLRGSQQFLPCTVVLTQVINRKNYITCFMLHVSYSSLNGKV